MKLSDINLLFEEVSIEQTHIDEFNRRLYKLDEKKRKACTIYPTDSGNQIRKKCKQAKVWGLHYAPVWDKYMADNPPAEIPSSGPSGDAGGEAGGDGAPAEGIKPQNKDNAFAFPHSLGPEDDEELREADSSTERVRRYYKRHPEKVRKYLKDTVKDRVARNRDRRKAVKKYGKKKMKNHDVHHPNGAQNELLVQQRLIDQTVMKNMESIGTTIKYLNQMQLGFISFQSSANDLLNKIITGKVTDTTAVKELIEKMLERIRNPTGNPGSSSAALPNESEERALREANQRRNGQPTAPPYTLPTAPSTTPSPVSQSRTEPDAAEQRTAALQLEINQLREVVAMRNTPPPVNGEQTVILTAIRSVLEDSSDKLDRIRDALA